MANLNKISNNIEKYSDYILSKLDQEIKELKKNSVAVQFDKKLVEKLSR